MTGFPLESRDAVVMTLDELLAPIVREIADINIRNGFRQEGRPPGDDARSAELWVEVRRIEGIYDASHPVGPCPACEGPRRASVFNGQCLNFGECREAPAALGG